MYLSSKWTQADIDRFNSKKGKSASEITHIQTVSAEKMDNSQRIVGNPSFALGRMKAGRMNKTEAMYAARLEALKHAGEIVWYEFEPMNLRLADKCFYSPDFLVMLKTGQLEVHECKGYWQEDALVKIKTAAAKFPFRFIAVRLVEGDWEIREF